ncbi:diguanylate cyclase domain-containing protein [Dechloromonas sp. HYN0024]|uniref:GGDEF domain-containing protein n=1 Tax=Dechloromonas sp. HYN0024 TaxID=2231055 RepID=UPI000E447E51|nr:diguanylate cyclase [Dechloromonas sp. HYN0024]AXS79585.1 diguanylate cyclase [Dechloromonas sp. HYN0024]
MAENTTHTTKAGTINSAGSMGGLLGIFVIACVEFQRHWPTGTGLIYLAISVPLLLIWIAHLAGWKLAERNAGLAVDIAIYVLIIASLGIRFGPSQSTSELATTLLFWSPLVAGWWAWRYKNMARQMWLLLGGFFVILTWQMASQHERLDEHLILSLLVALVVRYVSQSSAPDHNATMNLRDPLTGLPSPECFEAELAHVSSIFDRHQLPLSLVACRITPLATTQLQDAQLCQYAETITNRLRTSDTACQWDRTTFMILLPNTTEAMAGKLAQGIRNAFDHLDFGQKTPLAVTIATAQHQPGEDPMSTVSTLENKLVAAAE